MSTVTLYSTNAGDIDTSPKDVVARLKGITRAFLADQEKGWKEFSVKDIESRRDVSSKDGFQILINDKLAALISQMNSKKLYCKKIDSVSLIHSTLDLLGFISSRFKLGVEVGILSGIFCDTLYVLGAESAVSKFSSKLVSTKSA